MLEEVLECWNTGILGYWDKYWNDEVLEIWIEKGSAGILE